MAERGSYPGVITPSPNLKVEVFLDMGALI